MGICALGLQPSKQNGAHLVGDGPDQTTPWFQLQSEEPSWSVDETGHVQSMAMLFVFIAAFLSIQRQSTATAKTSNAFDSDEHEGGGLMVSAPTLHVVSTELAVGSFAMAGIAFLLAGLGSHGWLGMKRHLQRRPCRSFCLGLWPPRPSFRHHDGHPIKSRRRA